MLSLFSNMANAIKFAKYAALIPMVISLVKSVEQLSRHCDVSGEEKRAKVVESGQALINAFIKRGFLPPELGEMIGKDLGEITDAIVGVFNAVGIFETSSVIAPTA